MPLVLTDDHIRGLLQRFLGNRDLNHRYASFDFCFTYFSSFADKQQIVAEANIRRSCLEIGYFLASWGMLRGSSFLLRSANLNFYKSVLHAAVNQPQELWGLDVNNYNDQSIILIKNAFNSISAVFTENRNTTLTSKIMLGIYGNVPAFDTYVTQTYRSIFDGNCGFRAVNRKSLTCLKSFYDHHRAVIDEFQQRTLCHQFAGGFSQVHYTRAKLLDILAFQHGIDERRGN